MLSQLNLKNTCTASLRGTFKGGRAEAKGPDPSLQQLAIKFEHTRARQEQGPKAQDNKSSLPIYCNKYLIQKRCLISNICPSQSHN